MKKKQYNEIREEIHCHFDSDLVSGKIGDIINRLKNLPKEIKERVQSSTANFGKDYYDFELEIESQYDERDSFKVYGFRKETDAEYNARIKRSADAKKAAAARAGHAGSRSLRGDSITRASAICSRKDWSWALGDSI